MEILFDDSISIQRITSNYYEDADVDICLPESVKYEYLVRSGDNDEGFTYIFCGMDEFRDAKGITASSATIDFPAMADGIRITVYPGGQMDIYRRYLC